LFQKKERTRTHSRPEEGRRRVRLGEDVGDKESLQLLVELLVLLKERCQGTDHAQGSILGPVIPLLQRCGVIAAIKEQEVSKNWVVKGRDVLRAHLRRMSLQKERMGTRAKLFLWAASC